MLVPSKTISIEESSLYKACQLLEILDAPIELVELYKTNKKMFSDLSSYMDALDMLYVLGKIDIKEGVVQFA